MSIESAQNKKTITELVTAHNQLYPEDAIEIRDVNAVKDVSDLFVCVYNNNQVGLFSKLDLKTKPYYNYSWSINSTYRAESIYIGYNSNYVGIKLLHDNEYIKNKWQVEGYATKWKFTDGVKTYLANCDMYDAMSFDDMRLLMYEAGELSTPYEFGKATQEQILKTLLYAKKYYAGKHQRVR